MDMGKLATSLRPLAALLCAASLLTACSKSLEDVVAEHRPAVEKVFGQLKTLEGPVAMTPNVTEDRFDLGDAHVVLEGDAEGKKSNAVFIRAEDLAAPETATSDGNGALNARAVEMCGDALTGEFNGVAGGAELYMQECERAEYAFVLRTRADEAATLIGDSSFQPGRFEGDVLLFRLADAAPLGGFAVSAASSDSISVAVDSSGTPLDAIDRLNSDLEAEVFVAINDKLREQVPGSLPPL